MRILITNKLDPRVTGGAEQYIAHLGNVLRDLGHEAAFFVSDYGLKSSGYLSGEGSLTGSYAAEVLDHYFLGRGHYWLGTTNEFSEVASSYQPDLVIDNVSPMVYWPAYRGDWQTVSIVHEFHGLPGIARRDGWLGGIVGYIGETLIRLTENPVWAASEEMARRLESSVSPSRVRVLANAVPLPDERKILPYSERDRKVLFLGRLTRKKGLREIVEAWSRLEWDGELVVAGRGPESPWLEDVIDSREVPRLEALGFVSDDEKERLLAESLAFVQASRAEGFCRVNMEALSYGTPIVSTRVGGIRDYLRDGVNGAVIQAGDVRSIVRGLKSVIGDPDEWKRLSAAARDTSEDYGLDSMKATVETLLSELTAGHRRTGG